MLEGLLVSGVFLTTEGTEGTEGTEVEWLCDVGGEGCHGWFRASDEGRFFRHG